MDRAARRTLLRASLELSQGFLDEAEHLIAGGYSRGALSRLYLAVHHLVSGLLVTEGFQARDHDGSATLLNLYYVRTGRLSAPNAQLYSRLKQLAHDSNYLPAIQFAPEDVSEARIKVERFFTAARQELQVSGWLTPGSLEVL